MQLRWRRRPGIAAWPGFELRRGAPAPAQRVRAPRVQAFCGAKPCPGRIQFARGERKEQGSPQGVGPVGLAPPLQLRWRRQLGIAAWLGFEQRRGAPRRLYFSCIAKKSTQKKARKGGHPLSQPPVLSEVPVLHLRRPKPACSGTPAPTAVPWSGIVAWQGPQSAPGLVLCGSVNATPLSEGVMGRCGHRPLRVHSRIGSVPLNRLALGRPPFQEGAFRRWRPQASFLGGYFQ